MGKEKKEWLLFDVLKQQVRASGIISAEKYQKEYKNHSDWPSNPNIVYTEWKSWDDFLGKV